MKKKIVSLLDLLIRSSGTQVPTFEETPNYIGIYLMHMRDLCGLAISWKSESEISGDFYSKRRIERFL